MRVGTGPARDERAPGRVLTIADKLELEYDDLHRRSRAILRAEPRLRSFSSDDHDEVFHDAWLELWKQRERRTYRDLEYQFPTILRNKALDRLKHDRRHPAVSLEAGAEQANDDREVPDHAPSTAEQVERRWEAQLVSEIVDSLPERQRKLIKYRWGLGLSAPEIQARLGLPSRKRYDKELAAAGARVFDMAAGAREGGWCDRRRSLLKWYALGLASEAQRGQAERHVANCPACRTMVLEVRGVVRDVAALLPIPAESSTYERSWAAFSDLTASLRERVSEFVLAAKQQIQSLVARLTDSGAATTAEVASAGGLGGAGAAKVMLTVCLGGAAVGGAAVCVQSGVFPAPDVSRLLETEPPERQRARAAGEPVERRAAPPATPTRAGSTVKPRRLITALPKKRAARPAKRRQVRAEPRRAAVTTRTAEASTSNQEFGFEAAGPASAGTSVESPATASATSASGGGASTSAGSTRRRAQPTPTGGEFDSIP